MPSSMLHTFQACNKLKTCPSMAKQKNHGAKGEKIATIFLVLHPFMTLC
jgi:hypothetical protein